MPTTQQPFDPKRLPTPKEVRPNLWRTEYPTYVEYTQMHDRKGIKTLRVPKDNNGKYKVPENPD